jgi:protein O-GlcNAc transferase
LRPGHAQAIRPVAEVYRRAGRLQEASNLFQSLAQAEPDEWLYHYRAGTTLIELGDVERGIAALNRAAALAPSQGDVYAALGIAYVKSQRLELAIPMFEKAAVYLPFSPAVVTNLGAAYASRGSYEVARRHLNRAVQLGTFPLPRLYLTFTNLGLIAAREGHTQAAIAAFENALHLAPDYAHARNLLARARATGERAAPQSSAEPFVFNEMLEIFGEISTVVLSDE